MFSDKEMDHMDDFGQIVTECETHVALCDLESSQKS